MTIVFSEKSEQALHRFMNEYHITDRDTAIMRIVEDWLAGAGYHSSEDELPTIKQGLACVEDPDEVVQYPEFRDGDGGPGSGG